MEHILKIETDPTSFMRWFDEQIDCLDQAEFPTSDERYLYYYVALGSCSYLQYLADRSRRVDRSIKEGQPLELVLLGFYVYPGKPMSEPNATIPAESQSVWTDSPDRTQSKNVGCVLNVEISRIELHGASDNTRVRIKCDAPEMDHASVLLRGIAREWEHTTGQYTAELLETLRSHVSPHEWTEWTELRWAVALLAPTEKPLSSSEEPLGNDELAIQSDASSTATSSEAPMEEPNERYVFRKSDAVWELAYRNGKTLHMNDLKGLHYLSRLLANPNTGYGVLDLATAIEKNVPGSAADLGEDLDAESVSGGDDGYPVLDEKARADYQERLFVLREERKQAEETGDEAKIREIDSETRLISRELTTNSDIRGRSRSFAVPHERARTSVQKTIKHAIDSIGMLDVEFARYLKEHIATGGTCSYTVPPSEVIDWEV